MFTITTSSPKSSALRSIGIWMSVVLISYTFFNVARAIASPVEFADQYGLPLSDVNSVAFVFVYAIRTLVLGVFSLVILIQRRYEVLALFVLIATLLPLGDALLVALNGAALATILRHIAIAIFLVVTWFFLRRWALR
jgi:hypothetical protein